MLEFFSASTRVTNPQRAITECLEVALGDNVQDCDLVLMHASIGHDLGALTKQVKALCPHARVVASSGAGIVGREGASETLKDVALMAVRGKEFAVAKAENIFGRLNSYEKTVEMAQELKKADPNINMIYVLAPGIDIANDQVIAGIEAVFGSEIEIFGATSSDNMCGLRTYQAVDENVYEHTAFAIGFSDPTLEMHTQATHGFVAVGKPFVVTRSEKNRIIELDGMPAWKAFTERLGLPETATLSDTIPIGALAEKLSPAEAAEYGNQHILRVVTNYDQEGALLYATYCPEGTELWLTVRDEELIFADMERMNNTMNERAGGRKPVAVLQADCLARGRRLFNRIIKEELVMKMQSPFAKDGVTPPWLGVYGFGEFAKLSGKNAYHNYTTALGAIYRKS